MAGKTPITKRLREARKEAGISQKKLGIAAGIDEFVASARMNQYETGKHIPDFAMLDRIAKVLKVPTAYFYTKDDELACLIKLYTKLSIRKKSDLSVFLKNLSE